MVASDIVHGLKKNKFSGTEKTEISLFLERAFVRLEAWFQWFNTTQSGNTIYVRSALSTWNIFHFDQILDYYLNTGKQMSSYYWHGRDNRTVRELNPKVMLILFIYLFYICLKFSSYTFLVDPYISLIKASMVMLKIKTN